MPMDNIENKPKPAMKRRPKSYIPPLPTKNVPALEGQLPIIPLPPGVEKWDDFADAQSRTRAHTIQRLEQIDKQADFIKETVRRAIHLFRHGIQIPDIARAVGIQPAEYDVAPPPDAWHLRPDTNIAIIADMLEEAGKRGVSEKQMVAELRRRGRLGNAANPSRAVHWSVTELRRRTAFVGAREDEHRRTRWYAFGRFDVWRKPDTKNS
jgi:hypothetical protein